MLLICFRIDFTTTVFLHKKRFLVTFHVTQAETITFLRCLFAWWKSRLPGILPFYIHTIDTIVLSIEGNIHHKILFVLPYASFDSSFFRKFQDSGSFCSPLLCSRLFYTALSLFVLPFFSLTFDLYRWLFQFLVVTSGYEGSTLLVKKSNLLQVLHFLP